MKIKLLISTLLLFLATTVFAASTKTVVLNVTVNNMTPDSMFSLSAANSKVKFQGVSLSSQNNSIPVSAFRVQGNKIILNVGPQGGGQLTFSINGEIVMPKNTNMIRLTAMFPPGAQANAVIDNNHTVRLEPGVPTSLLI